jgi:hypothetical protein
MWPFKQKPVIDPETLDWQLECFEWLVSEFGADISITSRQLVLPQPGFFTTDGEKGHALAERLFASVKAYAGMSDWPVRLVADLPVPQYQAGFYQPQPLKHAVGTFSLQADNMVEITYQPHLLASPQQLIATFAHELAHYVLSTATTKPPCADDEGEFLTDITAVYLGFGVFMANNVLNFNSIHDLGGGGSGWSYARTGYLPENDLVHATAIFLKLSGESFDEAANSLKPGLARTLRRCCSELKDKTNKLEALADNPPASPVIPQSGTANLPQPSSFNIPTIDHPKPVGNINVSVTWQPNTSWSNPTVKIIAKEIKNNN